MARDVPVLHDVALRQGLIHFVGAPGARQAAFRGRMVTHVGTLGERFGLFCLEARSAQGEGEFASVVVRKDEMVESERRENLALD